MAALHAELKLRGTEIRNRLRFDAIRSWLEHAFAAIIHDIHPVFELEVSIMRNWLFAAFGAVGLLCTGIGAASAAPYAERPAMQHSSQAAHADPRVQKADYEWHHHRYHHRRWEHNHWRYWD